MLRRTEYVYAIQHNVTGRIYIGRTQNLQQRCTSHFSALKKGIHKIGLMQSDYNAYGDDYTVFIVDEIHSFDERGKEIEWMEKLKTYDPDIGYNYKDLHFSHRIQIDFVNGVPTPNKVI